MVPNTPTPTVFLADDDGQLRGFVSALIVQCGYNLIAINDDKTVVREAREFDETIDLLLSHVETPGVPDMTGLELAKRLNRERPYTKIFLLSGIESGMLILNHGWQFSPTPHTSDSLRGRIQDILRLPTPSTQNPSPSEVAQTGQKKLTKREAQTLTLIAGGNSTKQVAAILGIAFKTAEGHRTRLMTKLGIHDSATLVRYAIRSGVIDP
jgi:DNA-binding NarL/FixJ family response regulator